MTEDELDPLPLDMQRRRLTDRSPGEIAHPGWAYHDANGNPLAGPCDTPGCPYLSLPGGWRHEGYCEVRP